MLKIRAAFLTLLIGLAIIDSGCAKKETKAVEEKVINVNTQSTEKRSLRPFIESIGTLIPYEEVTISSELDGVLKNVSIDEGVAVSKGTILTTVDDTDYSLEVKRAEAALKQAEASLSNTMVDYKRKDTLYKEGLATTEEFDEVSTKLSLAEAEIDKARASLSLAKQKLSKTKIFSPISGVVSDKKVSTGDYVRNGTPLIRVIQIDPIKLSFTVPEKDVGKLEGGQDIIFRVDPFPDKEFKGKLSVIYPGLDEKTRTLQVEALVPNQNGLLKPGLFSRVTLYTGAQRGTIVVPVTAILYEAEQTKIFVVQDGRAKEKNIKLGNKYGDVMEITDGLKEGDIVVVAGQQNLSEGVKVRGNVAR